MATICNFGIQKKYFDFYEGTTDIFYVEELETFLSLCKKNIYAFKVESGRDYVAQWDICYPTCLLESAVDIEDIKEAYHKKYLNKYTVSLFSNINHVAVFKNDVFLATDDYNLHQYRLIANEWEEPQGEETTVEGHGKETGKDQDILLYDVEEKEGNNLYCYNYNWTYLRKIHIWKSINSVVSCFNLSEGKEKILTVGYNSGSINLYNLERYKLRLTYRIHSNRISCLKIYKNFIISADVTKHIFIYNWKEGKTLFSLEDHVSGINMFHFLRAGNNSKKETDESKKERYETNDQQGSTTVKGVHLDTNEKKEKEEDKEEEKEDRIIGLVTIGNDKIVNIWNLEMLNKDSDDGEGDSKDVEKRVSLLEDIGNEIGRMGENEEGEELREPSVIAEEKKKARKERKKQRRKYRHANMKIFKPIQQLLLSDDINDAMILSARVFEKSRFVIQNKNIKWIIVVHDENGTLYVYNPIDANILFQLKGNKKKINKSNICKFFLIRGEFYLFREDCSILVYNLNKWKLKNNYLTKSEGIFEMLCFDANIEAREQRNANKYVDVNNCTIRERDEDDQEKEQKTEAATEEEETDMEINAEVEKDKQIEEMNAAILIGDNIIRIVKMEHLIQQKLLLGHEDIVTSIKLHEKRMLLFSGSNDRNIFIWNLKTWERIYILKDNLFTINAIDINLKSFPAAVVVSVCEDNSLKMWKFSIQLDMKESHRKGKRKLKTYLGDTKEEELIDETQEKENGSKEPKEVHSSLSIYAHSTWINDVVLSPNGKIVVTCSKDKSLKLFETQHLKLLATLEGHKKPVQNVFFSANQSTLFSSSYDCLRIWDLVTYECIKNIQSFDFNITSVLLWKDNYLINGYSNGNINMINLKTCEKMGTTNFHQDKIFCLKSFRDHIISASVNGEILFLKNENEGLLKENLLEQKKRVFYENCLEDLLKNKKINESLLICLKMDKKFKFKTIIETYLNHYVFSIIQILQDWEMEVTKEKQKIENMIKKEKDHQKIGVLSNTTNNMVHTEYMKQDDQQSEIYSARNYLENSDRLTKYIYQELLKMEKEAEGGRGGETDLEYTDKKKNHHKTNVKVKMEDLKGRVMEHIEKENEMQENDENFVLFLKKLKEKSEHSYYLYLNKLIEFITFFVTNHKYAYIATFLLNSLLIYIDYEDVCKINNYQHFFEVYNSYLPRHKNRYLHFLQRSKCFQLININFYKGDVEMMK